MKNSLGLKLSYARLNLKKIKNKKKTWNFSSWSSSFIYNATIGLPEPHMGQSNLLKKNLYENATIGLSEPGIEQSNL